MHKAPRGDVRGVRGFRLLKGRIRRRLSRFQPSKTKATVVFGFECLPTAYLEICEMEENEKGRTQDMQCLRGCALVKDLGVGP